MTTKSPKKDRQICEFKEFYHEIVKNVYAEALKHEVSQDTIYHWRDPNKVLNMPAYAIIDSLYGDELLAWISAKRGTSIVYRLDGSVDDEWAELSVLFGMVRKRFMESVPYDFTIANELKKMLEKLLAEWREKGEDK